VLEVRELSFRILKGISFKVEPGDVVGVVGKNGAGKSTLLKCLGGYYRYRGQVFLKGREFLSYPLNRRVLLVNYLPQELSLPFDYTVREFLWITTGVKGFEPAVEKFGISALLDRNFNSLSGGEKVKVLLSRLYLLKPSVFLLDEPSAYLDLAVISLLSSFIKEMSYDRKSLLIVSHDVSFLYSVCKKFIGLKDGKLLFFGGKEELVENLETLFDCPLSVKLINGELFIKNKEV